MRILSDSSANLRKLPGADYVSVPLTIIISDHLYSDTPDLDVTAMIEDMKASKEASSTACPGVGEWLDAFGEAEEILVFTLTSTLSGCYNSAMSAAALYTETHPERKVKVIDTLSTGPEMELALEHAAAAAADGASFEEICERAEEDLRKTGLLFLLTSLDNFARNGRVRPAVAKLAGFLNIHIVGRASEGGELEPLHKCRGSKKGAELLWKEMLEAGYDGGKVRIRYTGEKKTILPLFRLILHDYPDADIKAGLNRGLCSYYAEDNGYLVGFEKKLPEADQNETDSIRKQLRKLLHHKGMSEDSTSRADEGKVL